MSEIRSRIVGCFGIVDLKFCSHPLDEKRAKQLRADPNVKKEELLIAIR